VVIGEKIHVGGGLSSASPIGGGTVKPLGKRDPKCVSGEKFGGVGAGMHNPGSPEKMNFSGPSVTKGGVGGWPVGESPLVRRKTKRRGRPGRVGPAVIGGPPGVPAKIAGVTTQNNEGCEWGSWGGGGGRKQARAEKKNCWESSWVGWTDLRQGAANGERGGGEGEGNHGACQRWVLRWGGWGGDEGGFSGEGGHLPGPRQMGGLGGGNPQGGWGKTGCVAKEPSSKGFPLPHRKYGQERPRREKKKSRCGGGNAKRRSREAESSVENKNQGKRKLFVRPHHLKENRRDKDKSTSRTTKLTGPLRVTGGGRKACFLRRNELVSIKCH